MFDYISKTSPALKCFVGKSRRHKRIVDEGSFKQNRANTDKKERVMPGQTKDSPASTAAEACDHTTWALQSNTII